MKSRMYIVNGSKWWYKNNKLHREDGPAVEHANGSKSWYKNSKRHREDGPAIEYANGSIEYWLNDIEYNHNNWVKELVNLGKMTETEAFLELI